MNPKITNNKLFLEAVKREFGNEFIILDDYKNSQTPIRVFHTKCYHFNTVVPNNFIRHKQMCKFCRRLKQKVKIRKVSSDLHLDDFEYCQAKLNAKYGNRYVLHREKWICETSPTLITDTLLKEDIVRVPHNLLRKNSLTSPSVNSRSIKYRRIAQQKCLDKLYPNEFVIGDDFTVTSMPCTIKHLKCGDVRKRRVTDIKIGKSYCPNCHSYKMERITDKWLKKHKIKFIPQKTFKDCRNKLPLPFDFYLPDYNLCIELDGKQHFMPINHFGGLKSFKSSQKRDHIKNAFCKNNSINLLRIKYTDEKIIPKIIKEKLDELGSK